MAREHRHGIRSDKAIRQRADPDRRGTEMPVEDDSELPDVACRSHVGGEALFWQPWTPPEIDDSWQLLFQLDGAEGSGEDAFALNFGGGIGYALLSQDQREGRFCWACV
ncbi:hypothetical protein [Actinoplanes xinjiangensis]|uniref:hypothetical protein n=1 Tax=Actinoplanes xinjiangensis TaxID=512350 RepID=UPI003425E95B